MRASPSHAAVVCSLLAAACVARPPEVIRLPRYELVLGPSYDPLLVWPTSPPPVIEAFGLERELARPTPWPPLIDYCVDPSGRVTSVDVLWADDARAIADQARGWTFVPWAGADDARLCESALVYNPTPRTRRSSAMIVVYLPIVPPLAPLPEDGSLDVVPARMVQDQHSRLWAFWLSARDAQGRALEPGFGEVRLRVCAEPDGLGFIDDRDVALDWLPEDQQLQVAHALGYNAWRFAPRLEHGAAVEDCDVEIRYAVWIIDANLLRYHENLYRHLNVDGDGFGFELISDLTPTAGYEAILGVDGAPAPVMIDAPSWLPPYELVASMPADMPAR